MQTPLSPENPLCLVRCSAACLRPLNSPSPCRPAFSPITLPATAPKADPLAGLKAEYRAAVQAEATAALDRVNLNELPAFQQELKRLQNGDPIPEVDEPGIPASLKRLREDYRQKRATQMR